MNERPCRTARYCVPADRIGVISCRTAFDIVIGSVLAWTPLTNIVTMTASSDMLNAATAKRSANAGPAALAAISSTARSMPRSARERDSSASHGRATLLRKPDPKDRAQA